MHGEHILTLGCHLSYCMLKFLPIVSRAFWGAIENGSGQEEKVTTSKSLFILTTKRTSENECIFLGSTSSLRRLTEKVD